MSTVNVNVNAQGLNQVLAALVELQGQMRAVGSAARTMQRQISSGNTGPNRGSAEPANVAGGAQRVAREAAASSQALRDNARRDSSALVAAYAEIASSAFALSAAFTLLNKSAQFGDMLNAQNRFAQATGTNMQTVAKALQTTTKYAINFQEAAQFSSIGRLAGFTTEQVRELAKIGTSAATILGRDVPDALSRMFRGVAKGEPEILDELGIFIRLDNAYKEYVKTVAQGQRVIDLTASQRRQATLLAVKNAGKAMAEGNSDAQINAFTTAQSNFVNALQQTMLTISNTLGPAVLWLSQNMAAMTALAVLMGSNVLRNLSNILVNQTRANTALEAAKNRLNEARSERNTLWGSAREQASALTTQGRLNALQESARQAEQAHQKATKNFLKEYQRAKSQEIQTQRALGVLTQEQARQASNELKNRVKSLASNPIAMASAAVSTTLNPSSTNSAIASANRLLETQRGLTTAQAAANGRVALTFNTAATAARTFGAAGIAAFNVAMAGAIRLNALLQVAITRFMTVGMSILGPVGVAYGLYQLGKVGLESVGLLNKHLSEFEDNLVSVNDRLDKTFERFSELGSFDGLDFSKASLNAEYMSNILDTTSTEIKTIMSQLSSEKMKETWLDKANLEGTANQFEKISKVLDANEKRVVLTRAKELMQNTAAAMPSARNRYIAQMHVYKDTQSLENLAKAAAGGRLKLEDYKVILKTVDPILTKSAERQKNYTDSLKDTSAATDLFKKAYNSLADTLRAESTLNEPITALEQLQNALKESQKQSDALATRPGVDRNVLLATLNTQIASLNQVREITGEAIIDTFKNDALLDTTKAYEKVKQLSDATLATSKQRIKETDNLRTATIQLTKTAEAYERRLANMALYYKNMGIDVSGITSSLSKLNKIGVEKNVANRTAAYLKQYRELAMSNSTSQALRDYERELGVKDKEALDLIKEAKLSMGDLTRDAFSVPFQLDFTTAMKALEPLLVEAGKKYGKELGDAIVSASAAINVIRNIVGNNTDYYSADFSGAANIKARDELYGYTETEKRANMLARLKEEVKSNGLLLKDYNELLDIHNKLTKESNDLLAESWNRQQAVFNGYDYGLDKLKLLTEVYADLGAESSTASRELQVYLQTLDMSTAKKVADLEAKLRAGAIERGVENAKDSISKLRSDTVSPDMLVNDQAAAAYRKQFEIVRDLEHKNIADSLAGREELAKANNELRRLEFELTEARKKAALDQLDSTKILASEAKRLAAEALKLERITAKSKAVTNTIEGGLSAIFSGSDAPLSEVNDTFTKEIRGLASTLSINQTKQGLADGKDKLLAYFKKEDASGNSTAKQFKAIQEKFSTGVKNLIGQDAYDGLKAAVPGLIQAATGRTDAERKQGLGNAIGAGIGQELGGPIGAAIGGTIGSMAGNYFAKKLKETGIVATVSDLGKVTANTLEVYKKGSLAGTKTITQVGSSIEAQAIAAMQNAVTSTRKNYETNILRMNDLTGNLFKLTLGNLAGVFTAKYTQGADSNKSQEELLKDFVKDYGNFLGKGQLGFLEQFQDITESLTDVLNRLVNSMVVADNTFKSAFGKGIGLIGDVSKGYIDNFLQTTGKSIISEAQDYVKPFMLSGVNNRDAAEKQAAYEQNYKYLANSLMSLMYKNNTPMEGGYGFYGNVASPNKDPNAAPWDKYPLDTMKWVLDWMVDTGGAAKGNVDALLKIENYLNGNGGSELRSIIVGLAAQDFTDRAIKAFQGNDISEKTAAFNEAMAKYSNAVTSSIIVTANNIDSVIDKLRVVNEENLPEGLAAVSNGLVVPIQEFNRNLKKAIESGASPEKIAEGIRLGTQLSEVITGVLEVFSNISLSDATGAQSFVKSVTEGLQSSFKSSAVDSFKKSLLAPLLLDVSNSIANAAVGGTSGFVASMKDYAFSGDAVVSQAKNMVQVLKDPAFTAAMSSVSIEFEKLMAVFDSASSSDATSKLTDGITDIIKQLKEAAYSFAVSGNEYSVALFRAREAFVEAGLSANLAEQPIADTFNQVKLLAAQGKISAERIDLVNEALQNMADASIAARDELVSVKDASGETYNLANDFIKSLSDDIIDDSQSLTAAKAALEGLMLVSADKLTAAKSAYLKAKSIGNSLDYNTKAGEFVQALEDNVQQQIDANTTLMNLAKDKYEAEKAQLDALTTIIEDIASFMKELKFDEQLSILKPIDRLNEAELSFNQLKAKVLQEAAAGTFDAEALAKLREDAKQLLVLGRDVYASGDEYTSLYNQVNSLLSSVSGKAAEEAKTYEASTKLYQDMSLSYAQQTRDLQLETVLQLKGIAQASAVDNAISIDLINALKYNQGLPQGLQLSDYYANLFSSAQSGGTVFTTPNTGYPQFEGIGQYNTANTVQKDVNAERLATVLDNLTAVLANLPVDVKSAITSTNNLVTRRT